MDLAHVAMPSRDGIGPFTCFDQRWQITADDPVLLALIDELFAPLRTNGAPGTSSVSYRIEHIGDGATYEVYRDDQPLPSSKQSSRTIGKLVWGINRQVIDGAMDRLVLHAAAAAADDGRVVLLPAPMEAGKTTLVTGLLDRGLAYLTDEAATVDPDLTVHGYAKPLSIDKGSWSLFEHHRPQLGDRLASLMAHQWQVPPHTFTRVIPNGRLTLIVFPAYDPEAPTTVERLNPIAALDHIRESTFAREGQPIPATKIASLANIVEQVPCFALRSGDLAEACTQVLHLLEGTDHV